MSQVLSADAVASLQAYVRYLQRLGLTEVPGVQFPAGRPTAAAAGAAVTAPPVPADHGHEVPAPPPVVASGVRLAQLATTAADCRACPLHAGRQHVVFGMGNPEADLVFVGEAPGYEEDVQGQPFVGPAGQLLTRIIEAMGLTREQVYILNVIKCRPPNNRNPLPEELAACRPIWQEQLACLRPRVICALGAFAAQALLQTDEKISRLRGRFHQLGEMQVMPTYHPAFLLRNPQYKRQVWDDMQRIQGVLGLR